MIKITMGFMIIVSIGALLFHTGCGVKRIPPTGEIIYDIRGVWNVNIGVGGHQDKAVCTFTGAKKEGTVTPETGAAGTYKVGGETGMKVEFYFFLRENDINSYKYCLGHFVDGNYMEGVGTTSWAAVRKIGF